MIKAIPTKYAGIEFRSKLEANVAACFDACGVVWAYEQEGYDLGGEWYLPDFWLPRAKQFVEVKGQADDPSLEKAIRFARAVRQGNEDEDEAARPAAVVVLTSPFVRHGGVYAPEDYPLNNVFGYGFNGVEQVDALLVLCRRCGALFFMTTEQGWTCSACGERSLHPRGFFDHALVCVEHVRGTTRYWSPVDLTALGGPLGRGPDDPAYADAHRASKILGLYEYSPERGA